MLKLCNGSRTGLGGVVGVHAVGGPVRETHGFVAKIAQRTIYRIVRSSTAGLITCVLYGSGPCRHLRTRRTPYAVYAAVRVRRLPPLLRASSGLCLHRSVRGDLHPQAAEHAWHTIEKGGAVARSPGRSILMNLAETRGPRLRKHHRWTSQGHPRTSPRH